MPPVARTHTIPPPTPELLTESFCERCGTRYTFESTTPKARRPGLGRARVLTRGLKNWVVEDGRSIEAAMADARRDEERTVASAQLEAFHQTFNFCMDCRQYTCTDCWNQVEGRCLTCAPMPGQAEAEAAAAAAGALAAEHAAAAHIADTNGTHAGMAWPTVDLSAEEAAAASMAVTADAAATPYVPTDLRPVELPDDEVETIVGAADVVEAAAVVEAVSEVAPSTDEAVVQAEAIAVEAEAIAAEATEVVEIEAEAVEIETVPEPEAAAVAADAEAEAVETEATLEPGPIQAPEVPMQPAPPAPAPAPAWTMVAPDEPSETPSAPPAWPPRAPVYQPPAQAPAPQAPATGEPGQPAWPTLPPAAFTVPAAQAVWEESSLGVINRPGSGVQACVSCGLPLSASARFCRRCGSRQG